MFVTKYVNTYIMIRHICKIYTQQSIALWSFFDDEW